MSMQYTVRRGANGKDVIPDGPEETLSPTLFALQSLTERIERLRILIEENEVVLPETFKRSVQAISAGTYTTLELAIDNAVDIIRTEMGD